MPECSNVRIRDLLPELIHDRLHGAARAEAQSHVDACADCRDELELLSRVRNAAPAPTVDAVRIASVVPMYRTPSPWRRVVQGPYLRIAAVIVLILGSIVVLRPSTQVQTEPIVSAVPADEMPSELALGEPLTDFTEGDLQALIEELNDLDAVTPVEADVDAPSLQGGD